MLFSLTSFGAATVAAQSPTIQTLPSPTTQSPVRPPLRRTMAPRRIGQSTLKGRVVYKDNRQPLKGVRLRIFEANSHSSNPDIGPPSAPYEIAAFTNNAGEFQVENLAAGKYYVTVEGAGIQSQSGFGMRLPIPMSAIPVREDFEEIVPRHDTEFTVDGNNAVEIEVGITRGGIISGKVTASNRKPAANIAVSFISREGSVGTPFMARYSTATDQNGDYRIEDLPPGDYLVAAAAEDKRATLDMLARLRGEAHVVTYHPAAIRIGEAMSVRVEPGRETNGVNVTLVERNTFTVSGMVTRQQDGSPLSGAMVLLRDKFRLLVTQQHHRA